MIAQRTQFPESAVLTPALTLRTLYSFSTDYAVCIIDWLSGDGFRICLTRSAQKLARLHLGNDLMILYHSSGVISQGVVANRMVQRVVVYNQHKLAYRKYTNHDV